MVYSNINASDEYLVSSDNVTILVWLKQYSNGITQFQKNLSNKNFFNKKTNAVLINVNFQNIVFLGKVIIKVNASNNTIVLLLNYLRFRNFI